MVEGNITVNIFHSGSPFCVDMEDATRVAVEGKSLEASPVNKMAEFHIDPSKAPYRANAIVKITGIKSYTIVDSTVCQLEDFQLPLVVSVLLTE